MPDLTQFLENSSAGGKIPSGELLPLVYDELRHLAARRMAKHGPAATLQPTALVHEAWLRLAGDGERQWEDKTHFFKTAAIAMRSILVDRARRKSSLKRGSGQENVPLDELEISKAEPEDRILMIDEVLGKLEQEDEESARIVTLKFFGGLTNKQIAELDGVSERTIDRQWSYARMRLFEMIQREHEA